MKDRKDIGFDEIRGKVLRVLGEEGLRIMTQMISNIYETGEWSKQFINFK
jgi:hypothetical protein